MPADRTTVGYLIVNLGTPASPAVSDVRAYLNEFLMDPYVLDTPWPIRRLIVSAFILPLRPRRSAAAYQSIWQEEGSPLLLNSQALLQSLQQQINEPVSLAMRYGQPSIKAAVEQLADQGVEHIVLAPLYPQYADSTVTTSVQELREHLPANMTYSVLQPFYNHPEYLQALARSVQEALPAQWDHLLLSYHGLPERHLTRCDPTGKHCLASEDCCSQPSPAHATCYRHQVYATSSGLAKALELPEDKYSVAFQSRLGRLPWLQPYTDQVLAELPGRGVRHLAVACPAFVADNLETLEEMGIQGQETFLAAGGESFHLVPCLNQLPYWGQALTRLLTDHNAAASAATSV
ncbi:MAG: ferrochelatase [Pseudomonadota bacterium]